MAMTARRGREHSGVGQREYRHQPAAAQHQPGFVAVPDRGDGIHHHVAVVLFFGKREEDADTEIEAVEDHVGKHRKGDEAGPDEGEINGHDALPFARLGPGRA